MWEDYDQSPSLCPISLSKIQSSIQGHTLHNLLSAASLTSSSTLLTFACSALTKPTTFLFLQQVKPTPISELCWSVPWKAFPLDIPLTGHSLLLVSDQMSPYLRSLPGSSQIKQHPYFSPRALSILSHGSILLYFKVSLPPYMLYIYQFITPPLVKQDGFWAQELCLFCLLLSPGPRRVLPPIRCLTKICLINVQTFIILSTNLDWLYAWHYFNC